MLICQSADSKNIRIDCNEVCMSKWKTDWRLLLYTIMTTSAVVIVNNMLLLFKSLCMAFFVFAFCLTLTCFNSKYEHQQIQRITWKKKNVRKRCYVKIQLTQKIITLVCETMSISCDVTCHLLTVLCTRCERQREKYCVYMTSMAFGKKRFPISSCTITACSVHWIMNIYLHISFVSISHLWTL